jgi:hypothetical protein
MPGKPVVKPRFFIIPMRKMYLLLEKMANFPANRRRERPRFFTSFVYFLLIFCLFMGANRRSLSPR